MPFYNFSPLRKSFTEKLTLIYASNQIASVPSLTALQNDAEQDAYVREVAKKSTLNEKETMNW
jgi:hypothetical protein